MENFWQSDLIVKIASLSIVIVFSTRGLVILAEYFRNFKKYLLDITGAYPTAKHKICYQKERKTDIQHVDGFPDGHITWDEYFMSVAQLASKRSKDPSTKVGACIVNKQNKIVATGYNGMPNGVGDNEVPWVKEGNFLETKYAYVVHAELNAILNCILTDLTGCRVFVSLFPCNECAKALIQTGIRHVIYLSDKHKDKDSTKAAKRMFEMSGVKFEPFPGRLLVN